MLIINVESGDHMPIYDREQNYISLLSDGEKTVKELSDKLFISEPTVRRDILALERKEIVTKKRGKVKLIINSADTRIPKFIRDMENQDQKRTIALKAISHVKEGYVIMLDASTTAYHLLPHLSAIKNIIVITNGAKTALEASSMGIKTICTGGELKPESFSYMGTDAENLLMKYNADVAFSLAEDFLTMVLQQTTQS